MHAFLISLVFVFIAEMGDKTQLVALAFSTRYKPTLVMSAILLSTTLVHLLSVWVGQAAGDMLPGSSVNLLAGAMFICFGIWTLRGDDPGKDKDRNHSRFGPLLSMAATFFLAELGDKTMLTTITIAAQQHQFLAVWLGSTLGMIIADGLAILIGRCIGKQLPEKAVRYATASVFFGSGAFSMINALVSHPQVL